MLLYASEPIHVYFMSLFASQHFGMLHRYVVASYLARTSCTARFDLDSCKDNAITASCTFLLDHLAL